jgi:2-keto-4-pentenoate hydratase/2-oxohepta-3-ene-1,7-dioic acid hydratase in catechol pathway
MPSRRTFVKTAGLLPLAALATPASADVLPPYKSDVVPTYRRPLELPRNLTALSIRQKDGRETLGVKTAAGVLDVVAARQLLGLNAAPTLEDLLQEGGAAALDTLVRQALAAPQAKPAFLDEASIRHGRLFVNPGKIICVGLNYRAHISETAEKIPKEPILFNKYNNSLAPHNVVLKLPPKEISHKFDYETELLIVMGKKGRDIPEAEALDYVAGYCVGHDFSARDLQLETGGQWMVGKTLDDFAPIGPYFVSADLVGDPNNLRLETRVNGEIRQSASTKDMIFNCRQLIAYISRLWTLDPGDLIFTGTPSGVIVGMPKDKQVWLAPGDKIVSSIEKLGDLTFELA